MKALILAAGLGLALPAAAQSLPQDTAWISAWTAPPIGYEPNIKQALGRPLANETVRQTVHLATSGRSLRIRLSNELSDTPLLIGGVSVARLDKSGAVVAGSLKTLTFGGAAAVRIPAHAPYLSDAVDYPVAAGDVLFVSVFYPGQNVTPPAHAQMAWVAPGDATRSETLGDAVRARAPGLVSGVEVDGAPAARVLVAFGDSITEGAGSSQYMSWPDQMARMMAAAPADRCWAVVNAGISGNRLLEDGRGPDALSRFGRDALDVPGVTHIVVLEGINDIGVGSDPAKPDLLVTADQLIDAYRQLAVRAHSRGLKIIVGTVLPYMGAAYATEAGEVKREAVNAWLRRNAALFDGLIDFEAAMRDPADPQKIRLGEQIGDHLHPNDAGYTRMAQTALPVVERTAPCD